MDVPKALLNEVTMALSSKTNGSLYINSVSHFSPSSFSQDLAVSDAC